ncbi:KRAB-A domain-containing protein 2-like [Agrilus planipennis]|uniref:KRAB-A domain-containing protein 2-like n=1 Tax=Agrilus planipennis TaxID=224129 RepID=A0A7F5R244_AGRPL|nr:KRAB-A domain-containing protein 2-like [Agrilus planipennis]
MALKTEFVSVPMQTEYDNCFTSANAENTCEDSELKEKFDQQLKDFYDSQGGRQKPWTIARVVEVISHLKTAKTAIELGIRRTPPQYYWGKRCDLISIDDEDYLILKKSTPDDPTVRVIPIEKYYDFLLEIHKESGHGGRDKMLYSIKNRGLYIQKKAVEIFVALCSICKRKTHIPRKNAFMKLTSLTGFNVRGQVDLIDFQTAPDGEYKWLLSYQDHTTKFLQLRPLRSKEASEVASELVKIFLTFGAPTVLQSDSGGEFTVEILEKIMKMWPDCKTIHASPRHPETQSCMERNNQDVENMLRIWMVANDSTSWSIGCYFVQYQKNTSYHRIIGRSPYRAVFGCDPKSTLENSVDS